jgi:hypothetical protein
MDYIRAADSVLRHAESELRDLLGEAGRAGAYDEVALLSDAARALAMLGQRITAVTPQQAPALTADGSEGHVVALRPVADMAGPNKSNGRAIGGAQFGRDERCVIKVAWSKTKGADYEHRAPIEVGRLLIKAILRHGGARRLVSSDKFLPLVNSDKTEIPSYQSYLCLAWLVHEGLIGKSGRRGYTIFDEEGIEKCFEERWENLPRM